VIGRVIWPKREPQFGVDPEQFRIFTRWRPRGCRLPIFDIIPLPVKARARVECALSVWSRRPHWGTTLGLNFLYVHLNRLIKENDLNMMYVIGSGHGGPGLVANTYLEGFIHRALSGD
jgi:hypothetical protein